MLLLTLHDWATDMTKAKSGRNIDDVARDYDEEAIEVFADIMRDPLAEHRDRLRAAENLVDRGHGKSITPLEVRSTGRKRDQLAAMSEDDLYAVVERAQLPRLTAATDVDYEVVDTRSDAELLGVDEELDPLLR